MQKHKIISKILQCKYRINAIDYDDEIAYDINVDDSYEVNTRATKLLRELTSYNHKMLREKYYIFLEKQLIIKDYMPFAKMPYWTPREAAMLSLKMHPDGMKEETLNEFRALDMRQDGKPTVPCYYDPCLERENILKRYIELGHFSQQPKHNEYLKIFEVQNWGKISNKLINALQEHSLLIDRLKSEDIDREKQMHVEQRASTTRENSYKKLVIAFLTMQYGWSYDDETKDKEVVERVCNDLGNSSKNLDITDANDELILSLDKKTIKTKIKECRDYINAKRA